MALVQQIYLYEILARFTEEGLMGCQKIEGVIVTDDATEPPTLISQSLKGAVPITKDEAALLLTNAVVVPPPPEPEPEPEPEAEAR